MKGETIKILIVDDHPIMYEGLKQLLSSEPDIKICRGVKNAKETFAALKKLDINLIIVDISLKNSINGIELVREIKHTNPYINILVLSMYEEVLYAERAIRAGARGYVMKSELTETIVNAIRHIMSGKIYLSEEMSSKILDDLVYGETKITGELVNKLSDREFEVFKMVGSGFNTANIADKLYVSTKTVDTYKSRIKLKLKLNSSSELLKYAIDWCHNRQKHTM